MATDEIRALFGYSSIVGLERSELDADFVLDTAALPGAPYQIGFEHVFLRKHPLSVTRRLSLRPEQGPRLDLALTLACGGFGDAVKLLFRSAAFLDHPATESIHDLTRLHTIGELALGWGAASPDELTVVLMVRRNVLVELRAAGEGIDSLEVARKLDDALAGLSPDKTNARPPDRLLDQLDPAGKGQPRVAVGDRLTLGSEPLESRTRFFVTTSGSVNRDLADAAVWYYRAGSETGEQRIATLTVGEGIVPTYEELAIEVF